MVKRAWVRAISRMGDPFGSSLSGHDIVHILQKKYGYTLYMCPNRCLRGWVHIHTKMYATHICICFATYLARNLI